MLQTLSLHFSLNDIADLKTGASLFFLITVFVAVIIFYYEMIVDHFQNMTAEKLDEHRNNRWKRNTILESIEMVIISTFWLWFATLFPLMTFPAMVNGTSWFIFCLCFLICFFLISTAVSIKRVEKKIDYANHQKKIAEYYDDPKNKAFFKEMDKKRKARENRNSEKGVQ